MKIGLFKITVEQESPLVFKHGENLAVLFWFLPLREWHFGIGYWPGVDYKGESVVRPVMKYYDFGPVSIRRGLG